MGWAKGRWEVSILVLLEVSLRQVQHSWEYILFPGFNPCFIGSISEAFQWLEQCVVEHEFQSLFYWKYL